MCCSCYCSLSCNYYYYYYYHFRDIVVSTSSGKVSKLAVSHDKLVELMSWNAHNYEAWIVTSDKWSSDVIYSGKEVKCKCIIIITALVSFEEYI